MALDYKSSLNRYRKYLTAASQQPLWRAGFVLVLSLVLLIILLLLVLRPTLITISSLLGQINSQREIEQKLDTKIASVQQAQTLLNSLQPKLVYLDHSLPTTADLGIWATAVETIASGSGVAITNFSLADIPLSHIATAAAQLSTLTKIDFTISVRGDYSQLAGFVDTLEKLPRLAVLTSVQFSRQNDGGLNLVAQGDINFAYTYAQKGY